MRAHPVGDDGLVAVSTDYPDVIPFLTYATDADARENAVAPVPPAGTPGQCGRSRPDDRASARAGHPARLPELGGVRGRGQDDRHGRAHRATSSSASPPPRPTGAGSDYDKLLARKRVDDPAAPAVNPWDSSYLDDRLKAEELAFDTQAMRPYFEYGRVKAGLMALIERLFGVRFRASPDVPVWHPDVECHDVLDGEHVLGRIFLDMHPRPDKYNHAAMFTMTTGKAGRRLPECALVCNLPRPGDEPALLQHSDVETFFHEFGHLIHHIFAGAAPVGGHQRHRHRVGLRRGAVAAARGVGPGRAHAGHVRGAPRDRRAAAGRHGGEAARGRGVRQGALRPAADVLRGAQPGAVPARSEAGWTRARWSGRPRSGSPRTGTSTAPTSTSASGTWTATRRSTTRTCGRWSSPRTCSPSSSGTGCCRPRPPAATASAVLAPGRLRPGRRPGGELPRPPVQLRRLPGLAQRLTSRRTNLVPIMTWRS